MNIQLGDHFEAMIREKVASGAHANASEVVREALRLLEEQDAKRRGPQAELAVAEQQIAAGETVAFTPELLDRLSREATENSRRGKPVKPAIRP